ncbi:MAG: outer membrane lipoprotein chaperone LolA [Myxococcota bacterium]
MSFSSLILTTSLVVAAAPEGAAAPKATDASALATRVQRFYDALEDFQAGFVQTYTRAALSRTIENSGTITVKKGGRLHWAYETPVERLFVADGKTLWVYEPEEAQVIVERGFSTKQRLGKALSFLWGEGKLSESFEVQVPSAHPFGKDAAVLELTPKKDKTFRKLVLHIDRKSGQVLASVLHETAGNTNRFDFRNPVVNAGIPNSKFEFVPPEGVDVVPISRP